MTWFLIRTIDGVLYYVLAMVLTPFIAGVVAPYSGEHEKYLSIMVSGSAVVALTIFLVSRYLTRRYLCPKSQ